MSGTSELDPASVAALLGNGIPSVLARRLMASSRFSARIGRMVDARLGDLPAVLDVAQSAALAMDKFGLAGLILRTGAVWYGRLIGRLIDGVSVRTLVAEIGPDLRSVALRHRDLAPDVIGADDVDGLVAGLERNGTACVKAWSQLQPASVALRLDLRLPRRPAPAEDHLQFGPTITERLLGELGQ